MSIARYYQACLSQILEDHVPKIEYVFDVGTRNWDYLSIYKMFSHLKKIEGIELSLLYFWRHRIFFWQGLFLWFHILKFKWSHSLSIKHTAGNFLNYQAKQSFDLVTYFLPFVSLYALLKWGLPLKHYKPFAHFEKAASLLKPHGFLVTCHLNEREFLLTQRFIGSKKKFKLDKFLKVKEKKGWPEYWCLWKKVN